VSARKQSNLPAYGKFTINSGELVWDKITEIVTIHGYEIYFKPSGDLYIGKLKNDRDNSNTFKISNQLNNSNIISAEYNDDISNRYSELQVTTQLDNGNNKTVKILDKTVPISKFMTINAANDQDPKQIGIQIREFNRTDGFRVIYRLPGFTQNQKLWKVNRLVRVIDNYLDIESDLVTQSVTFNFDTNTGPITTIQLSYEKDLINTEYPSSSVEGVIVA